MNIPEQEKENQTEIPEIIMKSINKIVNKLVQYIKKNINNIEFLQEKLSTLDKYITESFIQNNNLNIFFKTSTLSNYVYKPENNSTYKFKIAKLQRQLKQQHEIFQMKELAYLESLASFQKQYQKTEYNINENHKEENIINNTHDKKKSFLINDLNRSVKYKLLNNTNRNLNKSRTNKIEIKSPSQISIKNKILLLSFDQKNKDENNYNTRSNFYKTTNRKTPSSSVNNSEIDHKKINDELSARNRFENIYKLQGKKIKKCNEGCAIKHDFNELKKTIEDGKKKILQLRNSLVPKVYSKMPLK